MLVIPKTSLPCKPSLLCLVSITNTTTTVGGTVPVERDVGRGVGGTLYTFVYHTTVIASRKRKEGKEGSVIQVVVPSRPPLSTFNPSK